MKGKAQKNLFGGEERIGDGLAITKSSRAEETYGRVLEAAHVGGYVIERMFKSVEYLLQDNRWQRVGGGFEHPDDFMASLRFDNVKMLAEQRKKLSRMLKAAMPKVTQRAIAKTLGVGQMTVQRDLESNDSKHDDETRGEARELESKDSKLDLSGAEVAAMAHADAEYEWKFESRQQEIARRDREANARLNAEGRERRVLVSRDQKQLALVIGPNAAGSRASVWWQEYQSSNTSYREAQTRAASLEEQAVALEKRAK